MSKVEREDRQKGPIEIERARQRYRSMYRYAGRQRAIERRRQINAFSMPVCLRMWQIPPAHELQLEPLILIRRRAGRAEQRRRQANGGGTGKGGCGKKKKSTTKMSCQSHIIDHVPISTLQQLMASRHQGPLAAMDAVVSRVDRLPSTDSVCLGCSSCSC